MPSFHVILYLAVIPYAVPDYLPSRFILSWQFIDVVINFFHSREERAGTIGMKDSDYSKSTECQLLSVICGRLPTPFSFSQPPWRNPDEKTRLHHQYLLCLLFLPRR